MEDVLDLYQPEYNPERPVVCFDETSRQLTGEVRPPIEAAPGRVVPRQLYLPVGVNQFCRFTSLAWTRCWAALVR